MVPAPPLRWALAALVLGAGTRLLLGLGTDISPDETYYWLWGQRLDWGYYDHPPLVGWLIRGLGIRPVALLCGFGTVAALYGFARTVHGSHTAGLLAAALGCVLPAFVLAGVFTTPDSPLLLFWLLSLWALHEERWVWAGLLAGLCLLSKYTGVLLGVAVLTELLRRRRVPRGLLLACALAALAFLPVVLWNAAQGWQSFQFQLHHGLGESSARLRGLLHYVGSQAGMTGGATLLLGAYWLWRGPREQLLLKTAALVPWLVFAVASLRSRGEANWPSVAYLSLVVGVAGFRPKATALVSAFTGGAVLVLALLLVFPPRPAQDTTPVRRLHGWSELSSLRSTGLVAYAPTYQLASELAYYARLPVTTFESWRRSQYDFWSAPHVPPGADALWVSEGAPPPERLAHAFERHTQEPPIGRLQVYRLHRRRSAAPAPVDDAPSRLPPAVREEQEPRRDGLAGTARDGGGL